MPKIILRLFFLSLVLVLVLIGVDFYKHFLTPLPLDEEVHYQLTPGTSLQAVTAQLQQQNIIRRPLYFELYARFKGSGARLQAGEYRILPGMTPLELLNKFEQGDVLLHKFTIVEGWNFQQLRTALRQVPTLKHDIDPALDNPAVMKVLGIPEVHPEGWFYPDTYAYPQGSSDREFLQRAYRVMRDRLDREWAQRAEGLPLKTPYEALILASIIEKETAVPAERDLIAAVFINRLKKRMRLQTDPTVIYGLGEAYDGDIKFRDLRTDTPYNTYTRRGLPPTPIAMPGGAAIHAALHPAESNALYFVSKGDGSHQFSANLADHEAAVDQFQRKRRRQ